MADWVDGCRIRAMEGRCWSSAQLSLLNWWLSEGSGLLLESGVGSEVRAVGVELGAKFVSGYGQSEASAPGV